MFRQHRLRFPAGIQLQEPPHLFQREHLGGIGFRGQCLERCLAEILKAGIKRLRKIVGNSQSQGHDPKTMGGKWLPRNSESWLFVPSVRQAKPDFSLNLKRD